MNLHVSKATALTLIAELPLSAFLAGFPRCLPGEIAVIGDNCDLWNERIVRIYNRLPLKESEAA